MLFGNNIHEIRKDYTEFSVVVYMNLCEKETEASGKNLYHGVCEFQKADGTMITVKPIVNTAEDSIHGHFEDTLDAQERLQGDFDRIIGMIDTTIAGATETEFYQGMLDAAELERTIYAMGEENPAIGLMLAAGLSPLDIYNLIVGMDDTGSTSENFEEPDVPLLGGFSLN
jgi:hypothetical protein